MLPVDQSFLAPRTAAPIHDVDVTGERVVRSTRDVIQNHLERFGQQDLDGILADYASDAVLFTSSYAIRRWEEPWSDTATGTYIIDEASGL